jgi:hypothetical protein
MGAIHLILVSGDRVCFFAARTQFATAVSGMARFVSRRRSGRSIEQVAARGLWQLTILGAGARHRKAQTYAARSGRLCGLCGAVESFALNAET